MMSKKVLDVGNCGPDHSALSQMLSSRFGAQTLRAHGLEDTLATLEAGDVALVLVNRKLDRDYSDGLEIIKHLKTHDSYRDLPVMMITNYEEHQATAVAEGALPGFGKNSLRDPQTQSRLAEVLG